MINCPDTESAVQLVLQRGFVKRKCVVYYLVQQQNVKRGKKYFSWAPTTCFYPIFRFIECRPRQVLLYLFHRFSLVSSFTVWETCAGVFSFSSSQQWYISDVKRILLDHKLKLLKRNTCFHCRETNQKKEWNVNLLLYVISNLFKCDRTFSIFYSFFFSLVFGTVCPCGVYLYIHCCYFV